MGLGNRIGLFRPRLDERSADSFALLYDLPCLLSCPKAQAVNAVPSFHWQLWVYDFPCRYRRLVMVDILQAWA